MNKKYQKAFDTIKRVSLENHHCLMQSLDLLEKLKEVFEMLIKKMTIETDYYDSDFGCKKFQYIAYNGEPLNIENQELFDLLKEVLFDDK